MVSASRARTVDEPSRTKVSSKHVLTVFYRYFRFFGTNFSYTYRLDGLLINTSFLHPFKARVSRSIRDMEVYAVYVITGYGYNLATKTNFRFQLH